MGEHLNTPSFFALYGLLQMHARTFDPITRELEARTGLPASWYEVLACLEGCEDEGQRMNELADQLLISRGGATKLVARLEEAGYVERVTPREDRRATFAQITPEGKRVVDAAHPVQLELAEEYFGRFLDEDDLQQMSRVARKVLTGLGAECAWLDAAVAEHETAVAVAAPAPAKP